MLFGLWVGAKFLSVLANVRALAVASGAGLGGISKLLAAAGVGYAAHEGLNAADPNDRIGNWIDTHIPGAAWLDNAASRIGLGRTYSEQTMNAAGSNYQAGRLLSDIGGTQSQYQTYAQSVAGIEHADYGQMGGAGGKFAGRYQMSRDAISDAAKYLGENVPTQSQFLSDKDVQERYFEAYSDINARYLSKNSDVFKNASPGVKLAILGYAHNQGMGGALKWLQTGQVGKDAFGTSGTQYSDTIAANLLKGGISAPDSSITQYDSMMRDLAANAQSGGGDTTTNNSTYNVTVHAPGGDPKTVKGAVKAAFNDLGLASRQASYGLA